ncbi:hypothetical protein JDV09_19240 [Mycobacterium sp. Y57]|uniref:hypothetical protein n=1 Tax=Mycolicibacterium xanthum TaxID=2796469 RepID=UPI001C85B3EF|nr:hypothetical protein [Mycolicibacterium xanthum]MBX7434220.1 hypothetical protein [Mycolicibacterium xanthum]
MPATDGDKASTANVAAAIAKGLTHTDYGKTLAARGVVAVALDDDDALVQYRPDGTSTVLRTP